MRYEFDAPNGDRYALVVDGGSRRLLWQDPLDSGTWTDMLPREIPNQLFILACDLACERELLIGDKAEREEEG